VERWLINGVLHEKYPEVIGGKPMTVRNRTHSKTLIRIGAELDTWLRSLPKPSGEVLGGEAGVRLRRDPDLTVGVDVVYISDEVAKRQSNKTTLIEGIPTLTVEILSPSDNLDEIHDKINTYLNSGVPLIWIVDPYDRTVRVYRPDVKPQLFNDAQDLTAEPHLPGFRVAVARFFD
jgi:Uma2 family endonuclease